MGFQAPWIQPDLRPTVVMVAELDSSPFLLRPTCSSVEGSLALVLSEDCLRVGHFDGGC